MANLRTIDGLESPIQSLLREVHAKYSALREGPVAIDEAVYLSERAKGHRNRAIAYLELNNGMIEGDVEAHLDLYFRQCSVLMTAVDLAFIAATLAKGGMHPVTGDRALARDQVR